MITPFLDPWLAGLGLALALMTLVWLVSLVRRDAGVVDIFWGLGFVLSGWLYFWLTTGAQARRFLVLAMVTVWGLRLAAHIAWRGLGKGEDYRYAEMRAKHGDRFAWVSLFTVFGLQGVLVWLISVPLLQAQIADSPVELTWIDAIGVALFGIGLFFEAVGDRQLTRFRNDPTSRGKVLETGLWRYTRHPNYFGDSMVWWGLWVVALATPGSWWTVYSPLLMTFFLINVSGAALLEKKLARTRPGYADYVARTNTFFPWFPRAARKQP